MNGALSLIFFGGEGKGSKIYVWKLIVDYISAPPPPQSDYFPQLWPLLNFNTDSKNEFTIFEKPEKTPPKLKKTPKKQKSGKYASKHICSQFWPLLNVTTDFNNEFTIFEKSNKDPAKLKNPPKKN